MGWIYLMHLNVNVELVKDIFFWHSSIMTLNNMIKHGDGIQKFKLWIYEVYIFVWWYVCFVICCLQYSLFFVHSFLSTCCHVFWRSSTERFYSGLVSFYIEKSKSFLLFFIFFLLGQCLSNDAPNNIKRKRSI